MGVAVVRLASAALPSDSRLCSGFGVEQAPYGMQAQSYPKDGLLDSVCPSATPAALASEQEFQMLPKSRLNTVSVNYCSVGQDFPSGNLNLLTNSSGKNTPEEVTGLSGALGMRAAGQGVLPSAIEGGS